MPPLPLCRRRLPCPLRLTNQPWRRGQPCWQSGERRRRGRWRSGGSARPVALKVRTARHRRDPSGPTASLHSPRDATLPRLSFTAPPPNPMSSPPVRHQAGHLQARGLGVGRVPVLHCLYGAAGGWAVLQVSAARSLRVVGRCGVDPGGRFTCLVNGEGGGGSNSRQNGGWKRASGEIDETEGNGQRRRPTSPPRRLTMHITSPRQAAE